MQVVHAFKMARTHNFNGEPLGIVGRIKLYVHIGGLAELVNFWYKKSWPYQLYSDAIFVINASNELTRRNVQYGSRLDRLLLILDMTVTTIHKHNMRRIY